MFFLLTLLFVFVSSYLLNASLRKHALTLGLIDIPNGRSSHQLPTPRGGGLAFSLAFFSGLVLYFSASLWIDAYAFNLPLKNQYILCIPLFLMAFIGFLDDKKGLPVLTRLGGQALSALLTISLLYYQHSFPLYFFGANAFALILIVFLSTIYIIWSINYYNFMDGINGLAVIEALFVLTSMAVLYYLRASTFKEVAMQALLQAQLPLYALLIDALLGFLLWNFPKARLFMGDSGSNFLGMAFALFSLQSLALDSALFISWLILVAVFMTDTSLTLLRRLWQQESLTAAHRSHAYQRMSLYWNSHSKVTLAILLINVFGLFPLAYLVAMHHISGTLALLLAYLPLTLLFLRINASPYNPQRPPLRSKARPIL